MLDQIILALSVPALICLLFLKLNEESQLHRDKEESNHTEGVITRTVSRKTAFQNRRRETESDEALFLRLPRVRDDERTRRGEDRYSGVITTAVTVDVKRGAVVGLKEDRCKSVKRKWSHETSSGSDSTRLLRGRRERVTLIQETQSAIPTAVEQTRSIPLKTTALSHRIDIRQSTSELHDQPLHVRAANATKTKYSLFPKLTPHNYHRTLPTLSPVTCPTNHNSTSNLSQHNPTKGPSQHISREGHREEEVPDRRPAYEPTATLVVVERIEKRKGGRKWKNIFCCDDRRS
ncbi:hypothetical protein BDV96DRAFT_662371 [Lophiotrema nucula]|uniref:Uncharacterized protein n=1 Tax=Lophiotrema nucula TaxID=690887 RepID=A0A6A5Z2Q0_9PLEO|nr:hypothetical protein BDV96DRAFT_662371 [Lophiotrema nucula]